MNPEWQRDIERRLTTLERDHAVDGERYRNIEKRLDRIDGHIAKLVWLIIAAIVGGLMAFIMQGGLNVG